MPTRTRYGSATPSLASTTATVKPSTSERNIDNVILGDVMFRAWYPSMYVKDIVGKEVIEERKRGLGKGEVGELMLERLWVCQWCFRYTREVVEGRGHAGLCERRPGGLVDTVPGKRIYEHGKKEAWSVWEVDGEVDTLYCQNLSLFAKLFLDNKSVFFAVVDFYYFLLVHTSPTTGAQQVVGFFSKEKMSWDNNNLACILIFPPWQRKGLGALLIAVSYEISQREGILGGPEKPISNLGKKGYISFWSREIARYILSAKETDRKKSKGLLDLETISRETWIAIDDCLMALRDMDVCVAAGKGKGEVQRVRVDKEAVRRWAVARKLTLEPLIDPKGVLEGYGYRDVTDEEMGD